MRKPSSPSWTARVTLLLASKGGAHGGCSGGRVRTRLVSGGRHGGTWWNG
ncbi:MAG: hypothetical protein J6586_09950 [Snodgrassella sp.]|nr:hypothetical protein [Snodgrassella sp.]